MGSWWDPCAGETMTVMRGFFFILTSLLSRTFAQECYIQGSCQGGRLLGLLADNDNAAECLLECQDVSSCEGYTWDSDSKYCILWDSCSSIEIGDDCPTCVSGEQACPVCDLQDRLCDETIIQYTIAENKTVCEELCTDNTACNYYTFNHTDDSAQFPPLTCLEFSRCSTVAYCPTCITGQPGCTDFPIPTTTTAAPTNTTEVPDQSTEDPGNNTDPSNTTELP